MNREYKRWRHSTLQSYRGSMAGVQLALSRCRARLTGNWDKDTRVHNDMALWGGMAVDLAYAMEQLRGGLTPGQLAREARELEVPVASLPPTARPAIPAGIGEIRGPLAEALKELPDRQREVFILCEGQGLSPTEVAAMLGIRRQSVQVHLARARERLEVVT